VWLARDAWINYFIYIELGPWVHHGELARQRPPRFEQHGGGLAWQGPSKGVTSPAMGRRRKSFAWARLGAYSTWVEEELRRGAVARFSARDTRRWLTTFVFSNIFFVQICGAMSLMMLML
jgi:hypothetical protein